MWKVADQVIAHKLDVVFDVGLARRDHRDQFRNRALQTAGMPKLHYLDVDRETRLARMLRSNGQAPATHAFGTTPAMFEFMEEWFEPPTDDELYEAMIVCGG
jgi:predicted kinase